MLTWGEILKPYGNYVSRIFDISTGYTTLWANTKLDNTLEDRNDPRLRYEYRYSDDKQTWSEWFPLLEGEANLFAGQDTKTLYFQYQVHFYSKVNEDNAKHKGIEIVFYPFEMVYNVGDLSAYPKLWFRKVNGDGDIALLNTTNEQVLRLKGLKNNEEVFIDTYDQIIKSSLEPLGVYRYDNHNNVWLTFDAGENILDSKGEFDLDIRYYSPVLQD